MKLYLEDIIQLRKNRVRTGKAWIILPPLISSILVLLHINVISSFKEHSTQSASLSQIKAEDASEGGIRLTLYGEDEFIFIETERETIKIPASELIAGDTKKLDEFLDMKLRDIARTSILASRYSASKLFVTLAVDEQLSYAMIKPVIRALARAKLSRYGFEVRSPISLSQSHTSLRVDHEEEY